MYEDFNCDDDTALTRLTFTISTISTHFHHHHLKHHHLHRHQRPSHPHHYNHLPSAATTLATSELAQSLPDCLITNVTYFQAILALHHVLFKLLSPFHVFFREHTMEIIHIFHFSKSTRATFAVNLRPSPLALCV